MLNRISVQNFKSLKKVDIPLRSLNVLGGLNGMGKSSLIQVLLLIKQSSILLDTKINLQGDLCNLGKGADVLYQFAENEEIEFDIAFEIKALEEKGSNNFSFDCPPNATVLKGEELVFDNTIMLDTLLDSMQYISADRLGPSLMYDMNQEFVEKGYLGILGQFAAHYISVYGNRKRISKERQHPNGTSDFLASQINAWLGDISPGIRINTSEVAGADKMLVNYEFELLNGITRPFKPTNVGYGISYALSVVVALLIAEEDQILIIENPEAHIHPRGQAQLGKLMSLASSMGVQIILETHSDHIMNGIRVAVKEKLISHSDVLFPWFHKVTTDDEQYTEVIKIKVDEHGELSQYPKDFLEEWNNQLIKLI